MSLFECGKILIWSQV